MERTCTSLYGRRTEGGEGKCREIWSTIKVTMRVGPTIHALASDEMLRCRIRCGNLYSGAVISCSLSLSA